MDRPVQTALGTARARFTASMPRRQAELSVVVAKLAATPADGDAREDVRRRLHALYATAQVFQADALSLAVKTVIARLDAARADERALDARDLAALTELAAQLPSYVDDESVSAAPDAGGAMALAPITVTQSVSGFLSAPPLASVLVVHEPAVQARIRDLLPRERFEVAFASDAEQAIALVHRASPDVVFVSGELASLPDANLVRRLQSDPLSQVRAVYVLLPEGASYDAAFLRQSGADAVLVLPLSAESLAQLVEQHVPSAQGPSAARGTRALAGLSQGTVAEIAATLAEEIRSGIAESLRAGRNEAIRIDEPSELMAVAWSAIGKVRSHLAEQSRGRVRFRDDAGLDAPTFLTFGARAEEPLPIEPPSQASLLGRRVLVADDDPAVMWFFAGLLREAGARVLEAANGQAALELARRKRPDVVVADILMPKIDGFSLCRELRRDATLSHVPVILLSWKEDFLQRMRELDSGAAGYLRKEAGSRQILAAVTQALAPRTLLREQLQAGGEAQGRIEGLGVVPLLETVAAERQDARLSLRDAWNLFEVDMRAGQKLQVTRTAIDGSFSRGEAALLSLVGVTSGRFSVVSSATPLRNPLEEPFERALSNALQKLSALLDAVSDKRLVHVARVTFDDEVLASLLDSTPTRLAEVVAYLRTGDTTAHRLLLEGVFTPVELEDCLRELARRGAVVGVRDSDGVDLVALARREREQTPGALRYSTPPRPSLPLPEPPAAAAEAAVVDEAPAERVESREQLEARVGRLAERASPEPRTQPISPPPPRARRRPWSLALQVAFFVALGYVAGRFIERRASPVPSAAHVAVRRGASAPSQASPVVPPPPQPSAPPSPAADDAAFGRVLPFIDRSRGVEVGAEQGLVVVEYAGDDPPELRIGDRGYGRVPLAVALDAGRHEIVLRRVSGTSFRYLVVRSGETRVITLPADVH